MWSSSFSTCGLCGGSTSGTSSRGFVGACRCDRREPAQEQPAQKLPEAPAETTKTDHLEDHPNG